MSTLTSQKLCILQHQLVNCHRSPTPGNFPGHDNKPFKALTTNGSLNLAERALDTMASLDTKFTKVPSVPLNDIPLVSIKRLSETAGNSGFAQRMTDSDGFMLRMR